MKNQIMIGLVAVGLMAGCASREEHHRSTVMTESSGAEAGPRLGTTMNDLPEAVQKTIREHSADAKIADIDKETRTGRTVYEVQFAEPGKNPKLHIAEDGSIVNGD